MNIIQALPPPSELKLFLDEKSDFYNRPAFIELDPISIPHQFTNAADIEIAGMFAALLSWGQRKTIVQKANELMRRMDNDPASFVKNATGGDLNSLKGFKHRTFKDEDAIFIAKRLGTVYHQFGTLGAAFEQWSNNSGDIWLGLARFHQFMFNCDEPLERTRKHISTPVRKSACKRMNMYLRWMVRNDKKGVDFGLWKGVNQANLICPTDVHVTRVAKKFGLLTRKPADWLAAVELTQNLKAMDPKDPVKYDFALFGLGIERF